MKKLLNLLFENYTLTEQEAYQIMVEISEEKYSQVELASFLTVFNMRNITLDELKGYRRALLDLCLKIDLPKQAIDIVGTGGDGKDTFNISTLSCFVLAGAGNKKHQICANRFCFVNLVFVDNKIFSQNRN